MRLASAAIGRELARAADAATGGRKAVFWERLIERAYHDAGAARDDAASGGIALAPAYLAVALELDGGENESRTATAGLRAVAADVFRSGDAGLGFLERGAALLVFVPAARETRREQRAHGRDAAAQERRQGKTGTAFYRRRRDRRNAADPLCQRRRGASRVGDRAARSRSGTRCGLRRPRRVSACSTKAPTCGVCKRLPDASWNRCARTTASTKPSSNARCDSSSTSDKTSKRRRRNSTFTVTPCSTGCGRSAKSARHSLENPHDQLTLRMAVAIDALHST